MADTTRPVHLLWTGGWDSTFRLADLVITQRRQVQPHYGLNPIRVGAKRELQAQRNIRAALAAIDPAAASLVLPGVMHPVDELPPDPQVSAMLKRLNERSYLGAQYEWLARLAGTLDEPLELCVHQDDRAAGFLAGHVTQVDGGYVLPADCDDPDLALFARFRFPLFDVTKVDMAERARRQGFGHVLEMTWFCHSPTLLGRPCGFCGPCQYTRDEGLARRVPKPTRLRRVGYHSRDFGRRALRKARRVGWQVTAVRRTARSSTASR